jgi:adenosylhomocysteine nucleosidase
VIAVFVAMDAEVQPLLRTAALRGSGETAGFPVMHLDFAGHGALVCRTGLGRRAAEAAEAVLASFSPKAVLSAGTAGGLSPALGAGDVVICERVTALAGASVGCVEPLAADSGLLAAAMKAGEQAGLTVRVGRSLTVDGVVWGEKEKARLRRRTGDDIVEMESYWVGRVAGELDIPFLAVRVVSDGADDTLVEIPGLVGEDGTIDYSRFLPYVQQHPEQVALLAGISERSRRAIESLERFAAAFLPAVLKSAGGQP